jgi:hypothetical protein
MFAVVIELPSHSLCVNTVIIRAFYTSPFFIVNSFIIAKGVITIMAIATLHSNFSRIVLLLGVISLVACGGGGGGKKKPKDTTPEAFSFTASTNAATSAVVTSPAITVSGIDAPAPVSITGGEYSISGGAFTTSPGTVSSGQTIALKVMASSATNTPVDAVLSVGGVRATFRVTTAPDVAPAAFSFAATTNAALSSAITSAPITLSGYDVAVPVSITGGEYSINGGAFTSAAGTISPTQTIAVKVISSNANSTAVAATLTVGGVSATYSVTTLADAIPNAFAFTPAINAVPGSVNTSNAITVEGIDTTVPIVITGGEYSINGGAFTSVAGTVTNGQTVAVKAVALGGTELTHNAVVTIGSVNGTYSVTTILDTTAPVAEFKFPTPYTMSEATSVKVRGTATDEHAISSVKLVVNGTTEVLATPKAQGDFSSWTAEVPLTANAENEIKVVATDDRNNSISIDVANEVSIRQAPVANAFPDENNQFGSIFQGLVIDATGTRNRLLITEYDDVFSVDVKTGQRLKLIEGSEQLMSLSLEPIQDRLYASSDNSIIEYVLSSGERINKYTTGLLSNIHVMTIDFKNDIKSIVGIEYKYGGEGANIARFSLQTKEFSIISSDNLEPKIIASEGIALDSSHNRFLVSSGGQSQENDQHAVIAVDYNSGSHSILSSNSVGQGEGFIGLLPNGREAGLFHLAIGGNYLYLAEYPNKIFKIDLENGNRSVVEGITYRNASENYQLQVGYGAMQYEEESQLLYAIESFRGAVFVIDTETNERVILSKSKNNY